MAEGAQIHRSDASSPVPAPSNEDVKPSSVPKNHDLPALQYPLFPMMYNQTLPGFFPFQSQEQNDHGGGIYAIATMPFMSPLPGVPPPVALIPLTYSLPTRPAPTDGNNNEGQRQEVPQQHAPERQIVVRRFQIGFQLDLLLILKLAAVVFVFSQDGSKERLFFLLLFASIIYLYQTGALTPVIRWLSQWVQQAIAPPQPHVRQRNEQEPVPEGNAGAENVNQPNADAVNGGNWWGIAKEIQMIVVGFVTSLLPGFHNVD
ncbi:uncharacterized protein LOC116261528 [Nymphaea colorata]|nr:uncharacterized protein LOC116261528 [Nymphaea colorata]